MTSLANIIAQKSQPDTLAVQSAVKADLATLADKHRKSGTLGYEGQHALKRLVGLDLLKDILTGDAYDAVRDVVALSEAMSWGGAVEDAMEAVEQSQDELAKEALAVMREEEAA